MSRVDQVTQRNASAAEELASTAEEMASQAEALQQLVSYFRLAGVDAGPRPAAHLVPRVIAHPAPAKASGAPRPKAEHEALLWANGGGQHDRDYKPF
jgi:methyl-accepting chemotaxis protein